MTHGLSLALLLFLSLNSFASTSQAVLEERLYFDFQQKILSHSKSQVKGLHGFTRFEQGLFVDALWDLVEEKSPEALAALREVNDIHFTLLEKLRLGILKIKYDRALWLSEELLVELENALREPEADLKLVYTIAAYEEVLLGAGHAELIDLARTHEAYADVASSEDIRKEYSSDIFADVFYRSPDISRIMSGAYSRSVKLFMFCRQNRVFPCLMAMRDMHGEVVRNADGSLWTHPAFAQSRNNLPSTVRNGNTPAGVLSMDSVMPHADQQISFGRNRRIILNFIPRSANEALHRAVLPPSSHTSDWWRTAVIARDVGRNLLRIHGTGKINTDPTLPYFPFMPTIGCVAQRENVYNGIAYNDQRILLDQIMTALDLAPVFRNETAVKGFLYLMEIDNKPGSVTAEDLAALGIE